MLKSGKLANVIKEMRQAKLDVLGLTEVRWKDGGDFVSDGVRVINASGDESQRGVAVLLDGTEAKCITSVQRYSDRLLVVNLHASPRDLVLIHVYMPTTAHTDEEVDVLYEQMEAILQEMKGNSYVMVLGDWNAVVGESPEDDCVGKFSLGSRNDRGHKLVEFCKRNRMMITNTWFKHEKRRRYTWKSPG